jgi:hypothetical protein
VLDLKKLGKFKIQDTFFANKVISCNEYNIAHTKIGVGMCDKDQN